jgi:hypothetical protein
MPHQLFKQRVVLFAQINCKKRKCVQNERDRNSMAKEEIRMSLGLICSRQIEAVLAVHFSPISCLDIQKYVFFLPLVSFCSPCKHLFCVVFRWSNYPCPIETLWLLFGQRMDATCSARAVNLDNL